MMSGALQPDINVDMDVLSRNQSHNLETVCRVGGYDTTTAGGMRLVHRILGFCPQFDVVWDDLTVYQVPFFNLYSHSMTNRSHFAFTYDHPPSTSASTLLSRVLVLEILRFTKGARHDREKG